MTLAASLVGWFSFNRVGDVQARVNEGSVPELAAAFQVAQYGGILANAAPSLAAAQSSLELFQEGQRVDQTVLTFEEQMAVLQQGDSNSASVAQIRLSADMLISNIEEIRGEVSARLQLIEQRTAQQGELVGLRNQVSAVLVPAIDDQLFYTLTGYTELDGDPVARSEHFSEAEVFRYRRLAELEADANIASDLLATGFTLSDKSLLEPLRERFEVAASRIQRNLATLVGTRFHADAAPILPAAPRSGTRHEQLLRSGCERVRDHREQRGTAGSEQRTRTDAGVRGRQPGGRLPGAGRGGHRRVRAGHSHGPVDPAGDQRGERPGSAADRLAVRRQGPGAPHRPALGLDAPHGRRRSRSDRPDQRPGRGRRHGRHAGGLPAPRPGGAAPQPGGAARRRVAGQERRARRSPGRVAQGSGPDSDTREAGCSGRAHRRRRPTRSRTR